MQRDGPPDLTGETTIVTRLSVKVEARGFVEKLAKSVHERSTNGTNGQRMITMHHGRGQFLVSC